MSKKQAGFAVFESVIIVLYIVVLGLGGYLVWHNEKNKDKPVASVISNPPAPTVKTFADCQKAPGSVTEQSFPEVCVTKSGQHFTQPTSTSNSTAPAVKYLTISEWGVKIPLGKDDSGAYYTVDADQSAKDPSDLTVYATNADSIVGPQGVSCKGEYVAYLLRLPSDDPTWQPSTSVDDGNVDPSFGERTVVGNYRYAIATHKQYGPECFDKNPVKANDYEEDTVTSDKFDAVVNAFLTDFKSISSTN